MCGRASGWSKNEVWMAGPITFCEEIAQIPKGTIYQEWYQIVLFGDNCKRYQEYQRNSTSSQTPERQQPLPKDLRQCSKCKGQVSIPENKKANPKHKKMHVQTKHTNTHQVPMLATPLHPTLEALNFCIPIRPKHRDFNADNNGRSDTLNKLPMSPLMHGTQQISPLHTS